MIDPIGGRKWLIRFLIVEDELVLLDTLAYNLKQQGYTVETAKRWSIRN